MLNGVNTNTIIQIIIILCFLGLVVNYNRVDANAWFLTGIGLLLLTIWFPVPVWAGLAFILAGVIKRFF